MYNSDTRNPNVLQKTLLYFTIYNTLALIREIRYSFTLFNFKRNCLKFHRYCIVNWYSVRQKSYTDKSEM